MTPVRAMLLLWLFGASFAALGGSLGFLIGRFAPNYYRLVFPGRAWEQLDPVQIGTAFGLQQGVAAGVVLGVAVLLLQAWRDTRPVRGGEPDVLEKPAPRPWSRVVLLGLVLAAEALVIAPVAYLFGAMDGAWGQHQREERYREERYREERYREERQREERERQDVPRIRLDGPPVDPSGREASST